MNGKIKEKTDKDDAVCEDPPVLYVKGKKIVINEDLLADDYLNGESSYFENELRDVPYEDIYETIRYLQKDPFRRVRASNLFMNRKRAIRFLMTGTLKALRSLPIEMFNDFYKNEEIFIEGGKPPRKNTDMIYSVMMKGRNLSFALFMAIPLQENTDINFLALQNRLQKNETEEIYNFLCEVYRDDNEYLKSVRDSRDDLLSFLIKKINEQYANEKNRKKFYYNYIAKSNKDCL